MSDIDTVAMPTDLAEAVALVVREGPAYGVTVLVQTERGSRRIVESVELGHEEER